MDKFLPVCLIYFLLGYPVMAQETVKDKNFGRTDRFSDSLSRVNLVTSAPPFLYDALWEINGVSASTQGFLFKDIAFRGFNSQSNPGFSQFIDGMDLRLPGLSFFSGSISEIPAIDVAEVKLVSGLGYPGGALVINSKSPFSYPGLSAHYRVGLNHVDNISQKASPWETMALRYARVLNARLGFKATLSYSQGDDWQSQDASNFDRLRMQLRSGTRYTDPVYDGVNLYGDEPGTGLTLEQVGKVTAEKYEGIPCSCIPQPDQSVVRAYQEGLLPKIAATRTGYSEKDILDNDTRSFKASGALHYKLTPAIEASLQFNHASGTGTYTDFDRYALKSFSIGHYKAELTGNNFLLRAYTIRENSGDSYNASLLGSMINEAWKPSSVWIQEYTTAYAKQRLAGVADRDAHTSARVEADMGRPEAGSAAYNQLKTELSATDIGNASGARLVDRSNLYHVEGMYDFSKLLKEKLNLQAGASFRNYQPHTSGTLLDDANRDIEVDEYSAFVSLGKYLSRKFKVEGSVRFDRSESFAALYSPGISSTYLLNDHNRIRASYQLRYFNPSVQNRYLDFAMAGGSMRRIGGLPEIIEKYHLYTNRPYTAESYRRYLESDGNGILEEYLFDSDGIRPENTQTIEAGYEHDSGRWQFNAAAYYTLYRNYISAIDVFQRANASSGLLLMDRFLVPVNVQENLNSGGGSLGLAYGLGKLLLGGNFAYNRADKLPDSYDGGFNMPEFTFNTSVSGKDIVKNVGFRAVYRWQDNFYWRSGFVNGEVPAFGTVDAQVSLTLPQYNAVLKLGGSNLLNKYYITSYGNPMIGGMYYFSVLFDQLWK